MYGKKTSTVILLCLFCILHGNAQQVIWAFNAGGATKDYVQSSYRDEKSNLYIVGEFRGKNVDFDPSAAEAIYNATGESDGFIAEYNKEGKLILCITIGGPSKDKINGVSTDAEGNIYITGFFRGKNVDFDPSSAKALLSSHGDEGPDSGFGGDIFVAKYNAKGEYIWAFNVGGSSILDSGLTIKADADGSVYIGGFIRDVVDFDPELSHTAALNGKDGTAFLAHYTNAGKYQWALNFGAAETDNTVYDIELDKDHNVYITGFFQGKNIDFDPSSSTHALTASGYDGYLAKYTEAGKYVFAFNYGGSETDVARAMTIDKSGNLYILGDFKGKNVDFDPSDNKASLSSKGGSDMVLAKYNADGQYVWAFDMGGTGNEIGGEIDNNNESLYITGSFSGTVDFDPGTQATNLTSDGGFDIVLAKYNMGGDFEAAFKIGSYADDFGFDILAGEDNSFYLCGGFRGSDTPFDPALNFHLSAEGDEDAFLAKYNWPTPKIKKTDPRISSFFGTTTGTPAKPLFSSLPSSQTGLQFRNDLYEDDKINYYNWEYLYIGSGVAAGDINNDGLQDLYFGSTTGYCKLYLNMGHMQFRDITDPAGVNGGLGVKTGVTMVDVNYDGWLDIFVCKSGPFTPQYREKLLYINNQNGTFTESAKQYGLNDASFSTQAYFFDYDKDGDLDVFFLNHPNEFVTPMQINAMVVNNKMKLIDDTARTYVSHQIFENRQGHYFEVSKKAGISTYSFGLSASIHDFNNDGWPDIYVANDFKKPDLLYINDHNGHFSEKLSSYFDHISLSSMGSDISDINNDGLEDLFVADMAVADPVRQKQLFVQHLNYDKFQLMLQFNLNYQYPHNMLQLNNGNGHYSEIAYHAGLAETDWTWAPLMADYDNDGWRDFYITNGLRRDISDWDYKEFVLDSIKNEMARGHKVDLAEWFKLIPSTRVKNFFFRNTSSLEFLNTTDTWQDNPAPSFSNGAAWGDFDNDGDLDIVVNNVSDEPFLLQNNEQEISHHHYIRFRFLRNKFSEQELYGATVKLTNSKGQIQLQHYDPQRGYMSSMEHFLHFGIGKESSVTKAEVIYNSGKHQVFENLKADQVLTVYESDAVALPPSPPPTQSLFTNITAAKKFTYTQKENDFIDFKREPLIPYKCSRKGPFYAKADVNGDTREDLYIGGAAGNEGSLMLQNADGSFIAKPTLAFTKDKAFEDGGAVFFDADGDKDMDLYVASGGAEFPTGSPQYQDRLYLNDGKGNFTLSNNALPKESNNNTYVIALDFDGDGDLDIFSAAGVKPGQFPRHDNNLLLQNNKGIFTDVTNTIAPDLSKTGLVNYAAWSDLDGDQKPELVLAGEWMPLMFYSMKSGQLVLSDADVTIRKGLESSNMKLSAIKGWWYSVSIQDVNGDGKPDIIAGNRGTNSRIRAKMDEPCQIYAKDFDGNGSYDAVLGFYIEGKPYPMYHRDQLIDQMPMMRKKFYRYRLYAGTTLDKLFTPEQQQGMDIYSANCFESGVFINEGNNHYRFEPFPDEAQFSNISDFYITDLDKDGKVDIIAGGNSSDPEIGTGNYDAMAVVFLKGDGTGRFRADFMSGLNERGEIRKIVPVGERLILLKNNSIAAVYSIKK